MGSRPKLKHRVSLGRAVTSRGLRRRPSGPAATLPVRDPRGCAAVLVGAPAAGRQARDELRGQPPRDAPQVQLLPQQGLELPAAALGTTKGRVGGAATEPVLPALATRGPATGETLTRSLQPLRISERSCGHSPGSGKGWRRPRVSFVANGSQLCVCSAEHTRPSLLPQARRCQQLSRVLKTQTLVGTSVCPAGDAPTQAGEHALEDFPLRASRDRHHVLQVRKLNTEKVTDPRSVPQWSQY